jgi:uncharacterized protein DUF5317
MILIVLAALCLISVPLTGGHLRRLAESRLRHAWLGLLALALQLLIIAVAPDGAPSLHAAIHIGTYALIGGFLWANRRLPGIPVIATGAAANTIAIVANHGVMPAWAAAVRVAGLTHGAGFQNSAALAHSHLLWLGDIIPVPGPGPLRNVLSIGDCVIYAGLLLLLHRTCRATTGPQSELEAPVTRAASLPSGRLTS